MMVILTKVNWGYYAENDPAREDSTGVTTWDESAKDAVEKTVDARRNLISKLKRKKIPSLRRKPQQKTEC